MMQAIANRLRCVAQTVVKDCSRTSSETDSTLELGSHQADLSGQVDTEVERCAAHRSAGYVVALEL